MVDFDEITDSELEATEKDVQAGQPQVGGKAQGTVYDWSSAPDRVRAPPRVNLHGKVVTVEKCEIILPSVSQPWEKTRDKKKDVKACPFKLYYSEEGQQEFLSGVRIFRNDDGSYSHPSLTRDGQNQASALLKLYSDFKKKNINDVSMREFLGWLNSKPKVKIAGVSVRNPKTNATVVKNMPVSIEEG